VKDSRQLERRKPRITNPRGDRGADVPLRPSERTASARGVAGRGAVLRLPFDVPVDLRGQSECALHQAPRLAIHSNAQRASFSGNGARFLQVDATQVEVVGPERRHFGMAGPIADEVRDLLRLLALMRRTARVSARRRAA